MSTPSDELLVQRQLRAAEIALETARRRRFATDEALRKLQADVDRAQAALAESETARARDAEEARVQLASARALETLAEQRYHEERNRRLTAEQQLSGLRQEETKRGELERQLAAERRVQQLEGELELVTRRAAEFEYLVRMAAFDAFKLVRDATELVNSLLAKAGLAEPLKRLTTRPNELTGGDGHRTREDRTPQPPSVESVLDSQRLDAALERLRATTPPPDDSQ